MARIQSVVMVKIELDDECGTLIELTEQDGKIYAEGVFDVLSDRQASLAKKFFRAVKGLVVFDQKLRVFEPKEERKPDGES
jgi:hypothetical protein